MPAGMKMQEVSNMLWRNQANLRAFTAVIDAPGALLRERIFYAILLAKASRVEAVLILRLIVFLELDERRCGDAPNEVPGNRSGSGQRIVGIFDTVNDAAAIIYDENVYIHLTALVILQHKIPRVGMLCSFAETAINKDDVP